MWLKLRALEEGGGDRVCIFERGCKKQIIECLKAWLFSFGEGNVKLRKK
jgi:hypothetical protein